MRNANTCVRACFHALTNAHAHPHPHPHPHPRVRTRNKGGSAIVQHHSYPLLVTETREHARTRTHERKHTNVCSAPRAHKRTRPIPAAAFFQMSGGGSAIDEATHIKI